MNPASSAGETFESDDAHESAIHHTTDSAKIFTPNHADARTNEFVQHHERTVGEEVSHI